jgi:hypothetical protein
MEAHMPRMIGADRRRRRSAPALWACAALALATVAGALLPGAASASGKYSLLGVWDTYGTGGGYSGTFTISSMDLATGTFSGTGDGTMFVLKGVETGSAVTFTQSQGSYVSTDKATVAESNGTLEMTGGTFKDTNGTTGTFTARIKAPAAPAPVLGQSVAAGPVSGTVLVKRPGATTFTRLSSAALIPVGSTVNATHGRVRLTSAATSAGHVHRGVFYDGEFTLAQAASGITNLTLTGGAPCAAAATTATHAPARKRSLWGNAHGSFQTTGRYAAATDIGTRWLTDDECTGTLIRVAKGAVRVHDLVLHRTLVVRAPGRYLAKP